MWQGTAQHRNAKNHPSGAVYGNFYLKRTCTLAPLFRDAEHASVESDQAKMVETGEIARTARTHSSLLHRVTGHRNSFLGYLLDSYRRHSGPSGASRFCYSVEHTR